MNLHEAVQEYQDRVEKSYWVILEDGTKIERWRHYNVQRRVAQAACRYGGYVVTGTRHFCPLMCLQIDSVGSDKLKALLVGRDTAEQGFTDQFGAYLTREEAYIIAKEAGQIIREDHEPPRDGRPGVLYSECYI